MERALDAVHGLRFRDRIFTPGEQAYCETRGRRRAESYAARFAAKEAVMKALGVGWGAYASWTDIEVCRDEKGAPRIELAGAARETAARLGIVSIVLSLSHAAGLAAALVVAESARAPG
jgi:holo-[acyl-carrier protein] synthase